MKNIFGVMLLTFSGAVMAHDSFSWVSVDNKILHKIRPELSRSIEAVFTGESATVLKLTEAQIGELSGKIHDKLHRCGGFIQHSSPEEAIDALNSQGDSFFAQRAAFSDYAIDQKGLVVPMVSEVQESSLREMILKLSSFKTRYYKSDEGVKSSSYIRDNWAALAKNRTDIKVELFSHKNFKQPSIVMTIQGSEKPEEIVILGGHADSIHHFMGVPISWAKAPGADDNASGIAAITETIKILMRNNFKPKRTVQFMGYAGEEMGLLGSKDIAEVYKKKASKVVGVMQLDMVLHKGTKDKDIVMMTDFTNKAQNEFIGHLIDEYVKVSWGYSECGYGCSDHASWTNNGFPASMPFESTMKDSNPSIHTADDTLESSGGNASHAVKFAKLATAFVVEMAN